MSESSDRKADAAAADNAAAFKVTEFGRRRVAGRPWSPRRLTWIVLWPLLYLARRKAARHRGRRSRPAD